MKLPFLRLLKVLILLLPAAVLTFLASLHVPRSIPGQRAEPQVVIIPPGQSVQGIALILEEKGIIWSPPLFMAAARLWGKEGNLQAGRYTFPPRNSIASAIGKLVKGEMEYARVTIPEGLNTFEIAGRFQAEAGIDSQRFVDLAKDLQFIRTLGIEADGLEGYLFPNTYEVYFQMDAGDVIGRMVATFQTVFSEAYALRATEIGFTSREILTLASIIEEEAQVPDERPIISAVYHNRLKLGRPLEADPTVQFALGQHKPRLFEADLRVSSPYNTYMHAGLPPGPICNPGQASIEAALYPAAVDYLYFVAEGNGRHVFTRTFDQHVLAKNRIRKANRQVMSDE